MPRQPSSPPDLSTQGGRLRHARESRRFPSPRAAAKNFGWNEETYRSHEGLRRGKAGLKTDDIKKYAKAFGFRAEWIALGTGSPTAERDLSDLPPDAQALARQLWEVASGKRGEG